jgi:hypothetical protein
VELDGGNTGGGQLRASFRAACLVRVKISDRLLPLARAATTPTRSPGTTVSRWWTIAAGAAVGSTACSAGWVRKRRTRTSTALSRVAENSSHWPPGAVASSSRRTTGRKPGSATWSASSSTLISTSLRWQCPCSMRSAGRPGQATTMSARLAGRPPADSAGCRRRSSPRSGRPPWPGARARPGPG